MKYRQFEASDLALICNKSSAANVNGNNSREVVFFCVGIAIGALIAFAIYSNMSNAVAPSIPDNRPPKK